MHGSGKTLAFLVPLFEILHRREAELRPHQVGALVIEPTRELAVQVHSVLSQLAATWPKLRLALMVGGTDIQADMASFRERGGNVLVRVRALARALARARRGDAQARAATCR